MLYENDQQARDAAREAVLTALRDAKLVEAKADGATGLSVIETDAQRRGVAIIITLGGPDPLDVCEALDAAGVNSDYRADEPWRIYVRAPRDEPEVVDDHALEVEADGGDEEFEEVGTAAPSAVGVSFDRPVAGVVMQALVNEVDRLESTLRSLRRKAASPVRAETQADVDAAESALAVLRLGYDALAAAIVAFDERLESVREEA